MVTEEDKAEVVGNANITEDEDRLIATARSQRRFAVQHLLSASLFSRQVGELERANMGQEFGPFFEQILANASACVFACIASLEAYANEFYIDREVNFPHLQSDVAERFWQLFGQKPILEKFELALLLKNQPVLDRGKNPTQDIKALVNLRNALTHFRPEWEDEKQAHQTLSNQLQGKFKPSQFLPDEGTIFPLQWACHSCTTWAVTSCRKYLSAFESRAGIESKFQKFESRLLP